MPTAKAKRVTRTKKPVRATDRKAPRRTKPVKKAPRIGAFPKRTKRPTELPPATPPAPVEERRSYVTHLGVMGSTSNLLVVGDAQSIEDDWVQRVHAQLSGQFFVDFHGPAAVQLTEQLRNNRPWSTLDDGTIRIPVRGTIEAGQMVSSANHTLAELPHNDEPTTITATPIELTMLHALDATRDANRAGIVHGVRAIAVALPEENVCRVEVFVDAEGQPDEIRIRLR